MARDPESDLNELLCGSAGSSGSSPVHRLDPRAKWIVTILFAVTVTSYGRYEISRLMPLCFFPFALIALSGVSVCQVLKRMALAAPFILLIGLFNPFFDRSALLNFGPLPLSGGWVSFISIILRSLLLVSSVVLLMLTTRVDRLFLGLGKLGVPEILVTQLQFLNRYVFLLAGEFQRMSRAHSLRSCGKKGGITLATYGSLAGVLLLKTLDRAVRIHRAMLTRGFSGEIRLLSPLRFSLSFDGFFIAFWSIFFLTARFANVPEMLFGWAVGQ